ncbi:MAG: hypothetical protein ACI9OO_000391 [Bacteroidia bacterium]
MPHISWNEVESLFVSVHFWLFESTILRELGKYFEQALFLRLTPDAKKAAEAAFHEA